VLIQCYGRVGGSCVTLIKFGERDILNYGFADVMEIFSALNLNLNLNLFTFHKS
jgi:hypothetical protein